MRGLAPPQCHITDNDGTAHHGGSIGPGTADLGGWIRMLKPFVEETAAAIGQVPSAAVEFGAPDPDAEIDRIIELLRHEVPEFRMDW